MNNFTYPETESILKKAGDKITVSVHLDSIPAGVRYHNGCNTFDNGVIVAWHVNAEQPMPVYNSVILIDAFGCSTIAHIVLCTSRNLFTTNTSKNKLIDPSYNIYACSNKRLLTIKDVLFSHKSECKSFSKDASNGLFLSSFDIQLIIT